MPLAIWSTIQSMTWRMRRKGKCLLPWLQPLKRKPWQMPSDISSKALHKLWIWNLTSLRRSPCRSSLINQSLANPNTSKTSSRLWSETDKCCHRLISALVRVCKLRTRTLWNQSQQRVPCQLLQSREEGLWSQEFYRLNNSLRGNKSCEIRQRSYA